MAKILNKRSAVEGKMPTADQLDYGELAVNYNANDPFISIKDSNDQVVKLGSGGGSSETPATIKQKYESNLDTNAFTDAEKTKLSGIDPTTYATQTDLDGKVDKIAGKGLSTNDYTSGDATKVSNLGSYVTGLAMPGSEPSPSTQYNIAVRTTNPATGSTTFSNFAINGATTSKAGVMSASDKAKLDALNDSLNEKVANKVAISSSATTTQYPTAKSVWDLVQDVIATIPSGGLKVPVSIDLESNLPNPTTLEVGDYFFIQDMDVTESGHTGRAWINYTNAEAQTGPLMYYKVHDQYQSMDGVTITQTGGGEWQVNMTWLNQQIAAAIVNKVDKVAGKDLSTNDYTTTEKNKLSGIATGAQVNVLEGVQVNGTDLSITGKKVNVDLSSYATTSAMNTALGNKVDKVSGKGLSTNDYTTAEKTKLASLGSFGPYISAIAVNGDKSEVEIEVELTDPVTGNIQYDYQYFEPVKYWHLPNLLSTTSFALQMYNLGTIGDIITNTNDVQGVILDRQKFSGGNVYFRYIVNNTYYTLTINSAGNASTALTTWNLNNIPTISLAKGGTGATSSRAACSNLKAFGFEAPSAVYPYTTLDNTTVGAWYAAATSNITNAPVSGIPYRIHTYQINGTSNIVQEVLCTAGSYQRSYISGTWNKWSVSSSSRIVLEDWGRTYTLVGNSGGSYTTLTVPAPGIIAGEEYEIQVDIRISPDSFGVNMDLNCYHRCFGRIWGFEDNCLYINSVVPVGTSTAKPIALLAHTENNQIIFEYTGPQYSWININRIEIIKQITY